MGLITADQVGLPISPALIFTIRHVIFLPCVGLPAYKRLGKHTYFSCRADNVDARSQGLHTGIRVRGLCKAVLHNYQFTSPHLYNILRLSH